MDVNNSAETDQSFEKFKYRIELLKWLISSVALVIMTAIIDWGFRDRSAGLQEVQQYDKYVSELIVLNKDPGQKRMLAQFFSNVTPSEKLREGWSNYYKEVDKEFKASTAVVAVKDSLAKKEAITLAKKPNLTKNETLQKAKLDSSIAEYQTILNPKIILPSKPGVQEYLTAVAHESRGFSYLFQKDINNAILSFEASEKVYNSFHQTYEIANYLKSMRSKLEDKNSDEWKKAYGIIAAKYAWEMSDSVKSRLLNEAKQ